MSLSISKKDSIVQIELNRASVRNSFNPEMINAVTEAFEKIDQDKSVRAIILRGAGSVFCAGADLQWMQSMVDFSFDENRADSEKLYRMFQAIAECSWPVIGRVQGAAYGGALGLIACCDYVVAEKETQFCFSEVKIGLVPAVISSFITLKCNLSAVKPLMLNGDVFKTELALKLGLINEMTSGEAELERQVQNYARTFLSCGPEAVRETKKLLREVSKLSWDQQRDLTTKTIAERRVSSEGQEGLKAFLEKRKPAWGAH